MGGTKSVFVLAVLAVLAVLGRFLLAQSMALSRHAEFRRAALPSQFSRPYFGGLFSPLKIRPKIPAGKAPH
jgi:hypothetical protein